MFPLNPAADGAGPLVLVVEDNAVNLEVGVGILEGFGCQVEIAANGVEALHRHASGEYEDFMTGFVVDNGHVWGRPVGVTVAPDGSLLVTDDGSKSIWRISYTGK